MNNRPESVTESGLLLGDELVFQVVPVSVAWTYTASSVDLLLRPFVGHMQLS